MERFGHVSERVAGDEEEKVLFVPVVDSYKDDRGAIRRTSMHHIYKIQGGLSVRTDHNRHFGTCQ